MGSNENQLAEEVNYIYGTDSVEETATGFHGAGQSGEKPERRSRAPVDSRPAKSNRRFIFLGALAIFIFGAGLGAYFLFGDTFFGGGADVQMYSMSKNKQAVSPAQANAGNARRKNQTQTGRKPFLEVDVDDRALPAGGARSRQGDVPSAGLSGGTADTPREQNPRGTAIKNEPTEKAVPDWTDAVRQEIPPIRQTAVIKPDRDESSLLPDIRNALAEIKKSVDNIESRLGSTNEKTAPDAPDPALAEAVKDMTEEIRRLAQARDELQAALRETERRVDELTQDNSRLKGQMKKPVSERKSKITSQAGEAPPADASTINKWQIIGLSANRIVLKDGKGKIHNLGAGDSLTGVKIISVDIKTGNVKTSEGTLNYGG
jgi:hypothetical protein